MNENERYEQICRPAFDATEKKLDKILYLLQGNGSPGIITRIDRLEQKYQSASGVLGFLVKNWQIAAIVILVTVGSFRGASYSTQDIIEIAKQVKQLPAAVIDDSAQEQSK